MLNKSLNFHGFEFFIILGGFLIGIVGLLLDDKIRLNKMKVKIYSEVYK